jgi:hypothetical protein
MLFLNSPTPSRNKARASASPAHESRALTHAGLREGLGRSPRFTDLQREPSYWLTASLEMVLWETL